MLLLFCFMFLYLLIFSFISKFTIFWFICPHHTELLSGNPLISSCQIQCLFSFLFILALSAIFGTVSSPLQNTLPLCCWPRFLFTLSLVIPSLSSFQTPLLLLVPTVASSQGFHLLPIAILSRYILPEIISLKFYWDILHIPYNSPI